MIRKATAEDVSSILNLERMCFKNNAYSEEQIRWILADSDYQVFLFEEDGQEIGALMLTSYRKRGKVISVGVHPDWRKRGIGRQLMEWGERCFLDSGVRRVDLEVWVGNQEAISFYESLGYKIAGTLRAYYSGKLDAHKMRKELQR